MSFAPRETLFQFKNGGATRDRTADPLLAKQVLSHLSYSPIFGLMKTFNKDTLAE